MWNQPTCYLHFFGACVPCQKLVRRTFSAVNIVSCGLIFTLSPFVASLLDPKHEAIALMPPLLKLPNIHYETISITPLSFLPLCPEISRNLHQSVDFYRFLGNKSVFFWTPIPFNRSLTGFQSFQSCDGSFCHSSSTPMCRTRLVRAINTMATKMAWRWRCRSCGFRCWC